MDLYKNIQRINKRLQDMVMNLGIIVMWEKRSQHTFTRKILPLKNTMRILLKEMALNQESFLWKKESLSTRSISND